MPKHDEREEIVLVEGEFVEIDDPCLCAHCEDEFDEWSKKNFHNWEVLSGQLSRAQTQLRLYKQAFNIAMKDMQSCPCTIRNYTEDTVESISQFYLELAKGE